MYLNMNGLSEPNSCNQGTGGTGGDDGACTTPEIITSLITLATAPLGNNNCSPPRSTGDCHHASEALTYCSMMPPSSHELTSLPSPVYCGGGPQSSPVSIGGHHQQHHQQQHQQHPHRPHQSAQVPPPYQSPCGSPIGSSPPSIRATRTHLIKESLKVTIQCKRLANGQYIPSTTDFSMYNLKDELTPEDEERRRRRRERNKIAATKCRNKKKERTVTLLMESDHLEQTNQSLRSEIQRLEVEKQRLLDMLNYHIPACSLPSSYVPTSCSIVGM